MTPTRLILLPLVVLALGRIALPTPADACQIAITPFILDENAAGSGSEITEAPQVVQARLLGRTHGRDSCTGVIRLEVQLEPFVVVDDEPLGVELEREGLQGIHPDAAFLPFEGRIVAAGRRDLAGTELRARFVDRSGARSAWSDPVVIDDEVDDGLGGCSVGAGGASHVAWMLVLAGLILRGRRPGRAA